MPDEITTEQVLENLRKASEDPKTPSWMVALLSAVMVLIAGLSEQLKNALETIQGLREEVERLRREKYGRKSEKRARKKTPPLHKEATKKKRARRGVAALDKAAMPEEDVAHELGATEKVCPVCGGHEFRRMPNSEDSVEYRYEPARLVRVRHHREKWACKNGCSVLTAPGPSRVVEGGKFHSSVYADVLTKRLLDVIPFHRQAEAMERAGIPLSATTICDLFHQAAEVLEPLYEEIHKAIRTSDLIHADETRQPVVVPGKTRNSYVWTFATESLALFVHSKTRSGNVATKVLAETAGVLVADGYYGYNEATKEESRTRAGCWAHMRRKFVEAEEHEPEKVAWLLKKVGKIYEVEHDAGKEGITGTPAHLKMRQQRTRPVVDEIHKWLKEQERVARPKSPFGRAVSYALNQWKTLTVFLSNPGVPPDNNHAERQLRKIALGRKNSLFVGSDMSGRDYAVNMSVVMSCRLNDIDPSKYLTDVLPRIADTKVSNLRDLLPDRWKPDTG